MSHYEDERNLPARYRPLSPWAYFGYTILYSIPLIGFIFLIVNALSNGNINRRNFARSYFCIIVIVVILAVVSFLSPAVSHIWETLKA